MRRARRCWSSVLCPVAPNRWVRFRPPSESARQRWQWFALPNKNFHVGGRAKYVVRDIDACDRRQMAGMTFRWCSHIEFSPEKGGAHPDSEARPKFAVRHDLSCTCMTECQLAALTYVKAVLPVGFAASELVMCAGV